MEDTNQGWAHCVGMRLDVRTIELKDANDFVALHHRHHKPVRGHRFSTSVWDQDTETLVGVAICGRPVARALNPTKVLEVTRLCTDGTKHVASMLYAAAARAAEAIGYERIQTYILESEPGTSVKAAGWEYELTTDGGDWNTPTRMGRRTDQPQVPKHRYGKQLKKRTKVVALPLAA